MTELEKLIERTLLEWNEENLEYHNTRMVGDKQIYDIIERITNKVLAWVEKESVEINECEDCGKLNCYHPDHTTHIYLKAVPLEKLREEEG